MTDYDINDDDLPTFSPRDVMRRLERLELDALHHQHNLFPGDTKTSKAFTLAAPTPPPGPERDRGVMLDPDGMAMPAKPPTVEELESRRKAVATAPDVVAAREFLATKKAGSVEEVVRGALNYRKSDTTPDEGDFKSREQFSVSGVHPSQDGTDFLAKEIERWDAWKEVALAYNKGFDNAPVKLTTLSREVGGVQSAVAKAIALGLAAPADRVAERLANAIIAYRENIAEYLGADEAVPELIGKSEQGLTREDGEIIDHAAAYWTSAGADTQGEKTPKRPTGAGLDMGDKPDGWL